MKKVSIYSSNFSRQEDWKDLLEELDYSEEEIETIEEVELTINSADVGDNTMEKKMY